MNRPRSFDLTLERLVLGEGDRSERRAFSERLASDAAFRKRVLELQEDDRETLERHPPAAVEAELRRRVKGDRRLSQRLEPTRSAGPAQGMLRWLIPVAVLATAFAVWVPIHRHGSPILEDRAKGFAPQLHVYRQEGDRTLRLSDGAEARPSEVVQLSYVAGEDRFGALVSVDGRGTVTLHLPEEPDASTALDPGGETPLPHAFELDDAPRFERFFLVTSPEPVDVQAVIEAAERLGAEGARDLPRLDLDPSLVQVSFLLRKETP
jgi:anti-sigma factor RsiW